MMRIALRAIATLALASICVDPVLNAQKPTPSQDRVSPGWIFTPSMGFGGAWDSNVLLVSPASNPPQDYATPLDPAAALDYYGRRTQLSAGYAGTFLMYRSFGELNSSDQRARAYLQHKATRHLSFFAEESFAKAPTTDTLMIAGVPFFRVGSQINTLGGGLDAALAKHTTVRGTYTLRSVNFASDQRIGPDLQGGYAHEWTGTVTQALSARLSLGGVYEFQRALLTDGLDRFSISTVGGSVDYHLTEAVVLSGMAGFSRLTGGIPSVDRTGPALQAAISHRTPRLSLVASYERSFIPAYGFGGTVQNEQYTGSAHVPFSRNRGYVDGSIAWYNNQPIEITLPELQTWSLSSTLGYHLTRWLRVEGFLGRTQQDSHLPGGQIGRTQVGFRMVTAKPMRLR